MSNKLQDTKELILDTLHNITYKSENWVNFLNSASFNYKYPFDKQVMIYAQRPNATACADMKTWNTRLHRWIKKGANGIAIIDFTNNYEHLNYLFDIEDTYDNFGRKVNIWQVNHEYDRDIIEDLDNRYSNKLEMKDNLASAIISSAYLAVEDNLQDYITQFDELNDESILAGLNKEAKEDVIRDIMSKSIAFIELKRCGINPLEYFEESDFGNIGILNSARLISGVGTAIQEIAKSELQEIYKTNYNLIRQKISTFDKINNEIYNNKKEVGGNENEENNISSSRRSNDTRSRNQGQESSQSREIWSNEVELPKREQESNLYGNENRGNIGETFNGDRQKSNENGTGNNRENSKTGEHKRRIETKRPNEMGWSNELNKKSSRRNSEKGNDFQLNLFTNNIEKNQDKVLEKAEVTQNTPALFLSQEEIDNVLKDGANIENSKFRIYEHLSFPFNDEKASDYLKREYGIGGYANSERWIEYSSIGITIRKNEQSITLNWNSVAKRDLELIKNNEFFTQEEMKEYKKYEQDLKQDFAENFVDFCIDNDIYDWQSSPDEEIDKSNTKIQKTREDHIKDILNELNSKEDIQAEISYLKNVKSSEDDNEHLIKSIDVFIEYFNIYYYKLTSKENQLKQNEQIDLTTPEAKEFIGQAQKINDLFDAREQNGKPLNREEYYYNQNKIDENNVDNNEKSKNIIKIDYHISEKEIDYGTPKERYKNNIEAIKTLKQIENENRLATKEEQEILSKYVGWGGLADVFDDRKDSWKNEYLELKNLLDEDEYKDARASTLTSFYTPPIVIEAIYKALKNMGFETGNILEPSCRNWKLFWLTSKRTRKLKTLWS